MRGGFTYPRVLHPYPRTTIAWDELPSCVTPLLDYYHLGSRAPPRLGFTPAELQALSISDSSWALLSGYWNINQLSIDYA